MPGLPTLLALAALGGPAADPPPRLVLADVAVVRPRPRAATPAEVARIKALIARLADVDRPDIGYAQTIHGSAFAPVPGYAHGLSWTMTDHGLGASAAFRELVALGPHALPFLLDALGDARPTKLVLEHGGWKRGGTFDVIRDGATWFSDELPLGNRLNPREVRHADPPGARWRELSEHVQTYTVRVGDLCFVAVGQIVGRRYFAARYQMTSCTVLNSPVETPALRNRVRAIWTADDPARALFDSLWADYRTTGVPLGPDLYGWSFGSQLQREAVLRLLYYFPRKTAPVVAARLARMEVGRAEEGTAAFARRAMANGGVYADEFVQAVAWCTEPAVRTAVQGVFRRTADPAVFAAAAEAYGEADAELLIRKADDLLAGLTAVERERGASPFVLGVVAERAGGASRAWFRRRIDRAGPADRAELTAALGRATGTWPVPLLRVLLDDERPTAREYSVDELPPRPLAPHAPDDTRKVPVRVCDAAAEALAEIMREEWRRLPATRDRAALDRHIARLKSKIDAR